MGGLRKWGVEKSWVLVGGGEWANLGAGRERDYRGLVGNLWEGEGMADLSGENAHKTSSSIQIRESFWAVTRTLGNFGRERGLKTVGEKPGTCPERVGV